MVFQSQLIKKINKLPELLVPAGNLTTLKFALEYGADAVYVGGKEFNLRSFGSNFSQKDLEKAVKYTHDKDKKIYITLNSVIFENEISRFINYVDSIQALKFDGYIISDPGIIPVIRKFHKNAKIHMSTQLNTTNHLTVNHYADIGVNRINIARETRFEDLKEIVKNSEIEIEIFIHGSMCISYSGRCMLSKYMTGRDANKGECAHSCRWKYHLMEEQRPNLFYNITQETDGTYIYNSSDLCLLPKLKQIVSLRVSAFKIEGRMKTENYVAQTVWVYRKALDLIEKNRFDEDSIKFLMAEILKTSHRTYTLGFMFLDSFEELEDNEDVVITQDFKYIGTCIRKNSESGCREIIVKNQFKQGDILEILEPGKLPYCFKVDEIIIKRNNYEFLSDKANPNDVIVLKKLKKINPFSIIRKKKND